MAAHLVYRVARGIARHLRPLPCLAAIIAGPLCLTSVSEAAEVRPGLDVPAYTMIEVVLADGENCFIVPHIPYDPTKQTIELPPTINVLTSSTGSKLWTGPPGLYSVMSITATSQQLQYVRIRTPSPAPPPEPDPNPIPDPSPPGPDVPFPSPGLAVAVVYETQDTSRLPRAQRSIFTSATLIGYLATACVKLEDGFPAVRFWDDDYQAADLASVPKTMQDAYAAAKAAANGQPWIVISNGKTGFSGPLPQSIDETIALVGKYK